MADFVFYVQEQLPKPQVMFHFSDVGLAPDHVRQLYFRRAVCFPDDLSLRLSH